MHAIFVSSSSLVSSLRSELLSHSGSSETNINEFISKEMCDYGYGFRMLSFMIHRYMTWENPSEGTTQEIV